MTATSLAALRVVAASAHSLTHDKVRSLAGSPAPCAASASQAAEVRP